MYIQSNDGKLVNLGQAGVIEKALGTRGKWEIVACIPASSGIGIRQITIKEGLSKEETDGYLSTIRTRMSEFAAAHNGKLVNLRQAGIIKIASSVGQDSWDIVAIIPGGVRKTAGSPDGREVTIQVDLPLNEARAYLDNISEQFAQFFVVPQSVTRTLVNLKRVGFIKQYSRVGRNRWYIEVVFPECATADSPNGVTEIIAARLSWEEADAFLKAICENLNDKNLVISMDT